MKSLYESLLTGKVNKPDVYVRPSSRDELKQIIDEYIEEIKPRPGQKVDLNWIDISDIDNLNSLFRRGSYIPVIDTWKIDHVKRFDYMFADNPYITESPWPKLQEELLDERCYIGMFLRCVNLKTPPELPATQLTLECYWNMFFGCSSLVYAPELSATQLTPMCYCQMFADCKNIREAPVLPATKLASECYETMFAGCTSLKEPPELPATKLAPDCYGHMFKGCQFEEPPVLPATKLAPYCYAWMFEKCKIKYAPQLPATKLAEYCYYQMFQNCKSLTQRADIPPHLFKECDDLDMYKGCSRDI